MRESLAWEADANHDIFALKVTGFCDIAPYGDVASFLIIIQVRSLQKFWVAAEHNHAKGVIISWEKWGPTSTRWLPDQVIHNAVCVYGSQLL